MNYTERSAYHYILPEHLIAKIPVNPRDSSRLMVINRKTGTIDHKFFYQLQDYLNAEDQLIVNNTKVLPARLRGRKSSGAQVEILLHRPLGFNVWEALAKPARKLQPGTTIEIADDFHFTVLEDMGEGLKKIQFTSLKPFNELLLLYGEMPLPPYITHEKRLEDRERYQTVYADLLGAVAAPTAGLHFTESLLNKLVQKGIEILPITLHVGLGTFKPVQVDDIRKHVMHQENFSISEKVAVQINAKKGKHRQLCIGTTSCRALESSVDDKGNLISGDKETSIFITPGYNFQVTDCLLTNFHLPESTLLMLVSAFGGYELMRDAYQIAIREEYRFFSYGDAMLII